MSIKFLKARRIEDLEIESNVLVEQGYWPLEGGFIEEAIPDTPEKFILLMVKKPTTVPVKSKSVEKRTAKKKKKPTASKVKK